MYKKNLRLGELRLLSLSTLRLLLMLFSMIFLMLLILLFNLFSPFSMISSANAETDKTISLAKEDLEQLTQNDLQAREIIRRADRIRAPDKPFRYTLSLSEYKNGEPTPANTQTLDISMRFFKPSDAIPKGDARALVRFMLPTRDKGKAIFSDIEKMWYYSPGLRSPIPISRQQRLIGQVSNGDVVAADFDYSYISHLEGIEACGQDQCYRLSLVRRFPEVTYPKITYWVNQTTGGPFQAEFLSETGLVIKRSHYLDFQPILGERRPTKIIIEDALKKDNFTVMEYRDVQLESLPESHFQKEYLMRIN